MFFISCMNHTNSYRDFLVFGQSSNNERKSLFRERDNDKEHKSLF